MTAPTVQTQSWKMYALSAPSSDHLDRLATQTAAALAEGALLPEPGHDRHRLAVIARDAAEAAALLREPDPRLVFRSEVHPGEAGSPLPVFLFPGVGEQRTGVAREAYQWLGTFRAVLDDCAEQLIPLIGSDLREHLLAPSADDSDAVIRGGPDPLDETRLAQPAVFAVEYALAAQLRAWGVEPGALVGYSIGEYTAAAVAEVLPLPDALRLVAQRAHLIDGLPPGAMMLVLLAEDELAPYLGDEVCLAAVNAARLCVVSGPTAQLAALGSKLASQAVVTMNLSTRHAFHSSMMAPLDRPLRDALSAVDLRPPRIPIVSNVTGDWIAPAEVTDPTYWSRHMCQTVRFFDNLTRLWELPGVLAIETGPGQMLTSLANQHPLRAARPDATVLAPMSRLANRRGPVAALLEVAARAWVGGLDVPVAEVTADKEGSWTSH
ncbi:acyltransferase domain-containing protein [Micromonospora parathelypteridis]|uniref:Acyl transferase domain-containing protein n=1 Tax=Micromonospora parathelypteridis TaxID=1839617 RepID=A0A840VU30_9ACTN|nr:acyltransferase domain-containing protein [Micromonospora parathelypteridis]MBB5480803.1 acyl transferase domain-containing protein [Micromonospora parathelypteridis]GGO21539.1 acyltransferase [Micromonospora parathelypteridis]